MSRRETAEGRRAGAVADIRAGEEVGVGGGILSFSEVATGAAYDEKQAGAE